ncbi:Integrase-like protein [Gossypium australe]|uniref:Integrase-like protein n=1 Tax=Gossypium australe TaxID=47621 RepID=A0A5B6WYQ0_9ROSI|nr:Integrase-like protein [Gossypium australe]
MAREERTLRNYALPNLDMIQGTMTEDPNQHLKRFLQLFDTFKYNEVTDDAILLRLFPFSLIDNAFTWLDLLDAHVRSGLDGAIGGALMNRTEEDAYDLIENMEMNSYIKRKIGTRIPSNIENNPRREGKEHVKAIVFSSRRVLSSPENLTSEENKEDNSDLQENLQQVEKEPKLEEVAKLEEELIKEPALTNVAF